MFERYTERARRAIYFARWWALQRQAKYIETSDIILGAAYECLEGDGPIAWMHVDEPRFIALFAVGVGWVKRPEEKALPLSNSSKRALAYAAEEAGLDERYSIDSHHLFRGVLRTGDPVSRDLINSGYTLERVRRDSREASANIPDAKQRLKDLFAGSWLPGLRLRQYLVMTCVLAIFIAAVLYLRSQN